MRTQAGCRLSSLKTQLNAVRRSNACKVLGGTEYPYLRTVETVVGSRRPRNLFRSDTVRIVCIIRRGSALGVRHQPSAEPRERLRVKRQHIAYRVVRNRLAVIRNQLIFPR